MSIAWPVEQRATSWLLVLLLGLTLGPFWSDARAGVVFHEISWATDHIVVSATFIDESGSGLDHVRVVGSSGTALFPRTDLVDCPQIHTTPEFSVPLAENPVFGEAASCADVASGGAAGDAAYSLRVPHAFVRTLPVAGEPEPCSIPLAVREDAGTPCTAGRDAVAAIADEIAYLCDSLRLARISLEQAEWLVRQLAIGMAVLFAIAATLAFVASQTPPPVNLILGLLAGLLLIAAIVCAIFLADAVRSRDHAADELAHAESRLDDARERYRRAVEDAIRACCGHIPSGMSFDPPPCSSS